MSAPPEHYSLAGPLWSQFEDALHHAGAKGDTAEELINSLKKRFSRLEIERMHYVRMQRNALFHRNAKPLDDPQQWEEWCRDSLTRLLNEDEELSTTKPKAPVSDAFYFQMVAGVAVCGILLGSPVEALAFVAVACVLIWILNH